MNKKHNGQTVFELGKLPPIIADKKVFGEMTVRERREFYTHANGLFNEMGKPALSKEYIKSILLYPEWRLNELLLGGKKPKEERWQLYVNTLSFGLYQHLLTSLPEWQKNHQALTTEMQRSEKRIQEMQQDIEKYTPKATCHA